MADITPKLKLFIFLSFISLIFNLGISVSAMAIRQEDLNINTDLTEEELANEKWNVTSSSLVQMGVATGTSFVPFLDLINIAILDLDTTNSGVIVFLAIYFMITATLGALKFILILAMTTNFFPFMDV